MKPPSYVFQQFLPCVWGDLECQGVLMGPLCVTSLSTFRSLLLIKLHFRKSGLFNINSDLIFDSVSFTVFILESTSVSQNNFSVWMSCLMASWYLASKIPNRMCHLLGILKLIWLCSRIIHRQQAFKKIHASEYIMAKLYMDLKIVSKSSFISVFLMNLLKFPCMNLDAHSGSSIGSTEKDTLGTPKFLS